MASLTRQELQGYTQKLYRFLDDEHRITFRKMRGYEGEVNVKRYPTTIGLDPRRSIISTLIHEFLHYQYPDWTENQVIKMESRIINSLSERQIINVLKKLVAVL